MHFCDFQFECFLKFIKHLDLIVDELSITPFATGIFICYYLYYTLDINPLFSKLSTGLTVNCLSSFSCNCDSYFIFCLHIIPYILIEFINKMILKLLFILISFEDTLMFILFIIPNKTQFYSFTQKLMEKEIKQFCDIERNSPTWSLDCIFKSSF